ncbi:MAG: PLP-dependent aminotransferase family protein [Solirubrobacteraceae bacterium]
MSDDTSSQVLVQRLRSELAGRAPGDRLASTRQLVEAHRVSPVTVSRALSTLAAEGLLVTRPGMGTFVAEPRGSAEPIDLSWQTAALADGAVDTRGLEPLAEPGDEDTISLTMGYLHGSLMPVKLLSAALARASRLPNVWSRPPVSGLAGLRTWFAQQAAPGLDARDVTITSGGQGALSAVLRSLVRAGQPLLVESPTYPGAIAVARAAGIRVVPVPTDEHGVIPELLDELFHRTGARAFYTQPAFQNPTGASLAPERRAEVLAAAARAGAFVVEDDFAHWLSHDGHAPRPLLPDDRDGRVVYIASLTKVASPALRVAAVIARGPVAERVRSLRIVDDMFVHRPVQEAALELVSRPGWQRHVAGLGQTLERRSRTLARAIAEHLPACTLGARPQGGMHLWVRLPDGCDDTAIAAAAARRGVTVMRGSLFYPAEAPAPHLRITFSATPTEAELDTGIRRLAAAAPELAAGA